MKIDKTIFDKQILDIANQMKNIKVVSTYNYYTQQIDSCIESIKEHEFRLTVVGEFSSGKSTFLNALIGKDILPHASSETTATITYIHNVKKDDNLENKAIIHFYPTTDKKDIIVDIQTEKQKFQDHLSALNKIINVVKEIDCVDVYVNFVNNESPFVIVDTPGLNGVADGHRDVTVREIRRSHASICLFHLNGIKQTDLLFMKELMKYQKTFFFVINHIDEIKPHEESIEYRLKQFIADIKLNIYNNEQTPEYVFGISALCALAAKDTTIKRLYQSDKEDLTQQAREDCLKLSRFDILEKAIFDYLAGSEKEIQFYLSVLQHLKSILFEVKSSSQKKKAVYEADLGCIPEIQILEDELKIIEDSVDNNKTELTNQLVAEIETFRKKLDTEIKSNCIAQYDEICNEISRMSESSEIEEAFKKNKFDKQVTSFYGSMCDQLEQKITNKCIVIYNGILSEMERMLPRLIFKDKDLSVNRSVVFEGKNHQYSQSNQQAELRDEINKAKETIAQKETENKALNDKINHNKYNLRTQENNVDILKVEQNSEISQFNQSRPMYREWKKEKGIIGKIWGFFSGSGSYYYEDNQSEIEAWDRAKDSNIAAIRNRYDDEIANGEKKIKCYKDCLANLQEDLEDNEKEISDLKSGLRLLEIKLQESKAREEMEKANAERDWIKQKKNALISQIGRFLAAPNGEVIEDLQNGVRDNLKTSEIEMSKSITKKYDQKMEEYRECIATLINRQRNKLEIKSKEDNLNLIKSDLDLIDTCDNQIISLTKQIS